MTELLWLRCGRPAWFLGLRAALTVLALVGIVLAPLEPHFTLSLALLCLAPLMYRRSDRAWPGCRCSLGWSDDSAIFIHDYRSGLVEHATYSGHHWCSQHLCVLSLNTAEGKALNVLIFAAMNETAAWRRLRSRLQTQAGQPEAARLVC